MWMTPPSSTTLSTIMRVQIRRKSTICIKCCTENNILLNFSKTKEQIVDLRKERSKDTHPCLLTWAELKQVNSFRFQWIKITKNLLWPSHSTTLVKKTFWDGAGVPVNQIHRELIMAITLHHHAGPPHPPKKYTTGNKQTWYWNGKWTLEDH